MINTIPPVHFIVEWDHTSAAFSEVSGLSGDNEIIDPADGGENGVHFRTLPKSTKCSNFILKQGVINDLEEGNWVTSLADVDLQKKDVTIRFLNEKHETLFSWKVYEAFPVKVVFRDFNAKEKKIIVETAELAF